MNLKPLFLLALASVFGSGCGRDYQNRRSTTKDSGTIENLVVKPVQPPKTEAGHAMKLLVADEKSHALQAAPASEAVAGLVTFRKDRIFAREFLYGVDLQYSSGADAQYELIPQSQTFGHLPAAFRRVGDELQLVADQSRLFESDVNHPELLLGAFKIVDESADTVTVAYLSPTPVLNELTNGKGSDAPKQAWVRSLEYVEQGDYLLAETAIMLKDGTVQTYLESVFPRANLVPTEYKGLEANADFEPLADRYRFLKAEDVFVPKDKDGQNVRLKTAYASRFNVGESGTIDWYVTPNLPDKLLPVVKSGVEGWNRYFGRDLGRDVMVFKGRLPAGAKLGDPRYNIINYDTVADAGAAYESQAADPLTGIQSHSLIYFPYAWYNIGAELWKKRTDTHLPSGDSLRSHLEPKGVQGIFAKGSVLKCVASVDDATLPAALIADAIARADQGPNVPVPADIDEFSKRLMISTLFHEVGHALGLAHNFKGSLAFDGLKKVGVENPTTWSVMDYNYYQLEQDLFQTVGGTEGPLLEYDRQIISQLYNQGKAVKEGDKVVPACNDEEADNTEGGADPLCVRYDSENNPSLGVVHAWGNLTAKTGAADTEAKTLTEMLVDLKDAAGLKVSDAKTVASVDAATQAAKDFGGKVGELVNYFVSSGAQSVRANLNVNSKALRVWTDGIEVNEAEFRSRYLQVAKEAMALRSLPAAPKAAVEDLAQALAGAARENTALGTAVDERSKAAEKVVDAFKKAVDEKIRASLKRLRTTIYQTLTFDLKNPYALTLGTNGELSQFEDVAAAWLAEGTLFGLNLDAAQIGKFNDERLVAAKVLLTFKDASPKYEETVQALKVLVTKGRETGNEKLVTAARAALAVLEGKGEKEKN